MISDKEIIPVTVDKTADQIRITRGLVVNLEKEAAGIHTLSTLFIF